MSRSKIGDLVLVVGGELREQRRDACPISLSWPRSTRIITLVAVATGLVIEAMSNTVSVVIGSFARLELLVAVGLEQHDLAAAADADHAAGHAFFGEPLGDDGVDPLEMLGVHARRRLARRGGGRQQGNDATARQKTSEARIGK